MLTTNTAPAIILGGGSGNGLGIVRNLGSRGIPVYSVTSNPRELSRFSKYSAGATIVPNVEQDSAILSSVLQKLRQHLSTTAVLFPTTDTMMLTVAQIQDQLTQYLMNISSQDVIETMVIKTRFYPSIRSAGIPHPRTLLPGEIDLETVEQQVTFPVFLRPAQSLLFHKQFHKKGFVARTLRELRIYLQHTQWHQLEMMIQEIIPGPTTQGYTVRGYFNRQSRPLVLFVTQKIRQPRMFSNNCVKMSLPITQLEEEVHVLVHYLKDLQYRGLFGAEYKRDPRDGTLKLLEINARSMGGNLFPSLLGANSLLIAYQDILGESVTPIMSYPYGIYGINLLFDLPILIKRGLTGRIASRDLIPYLNKKYWSRFSTDDPLPFVKSIHNLIRDQLTR
jgi:predicted ATP-grasp superfamily ATP-dependent carboligase